MNNALNSALPFLNASQMIEQASALDAIYNRTVKAIARLQKDVDTAKAAVASRWSGTNVSHAIRSQAEAEDARMAVMGIREKAEKELDGLMKEAGAAHNSIITQRPFYSSPVLTLNRLTLGSAKRSEYARQIASAGTAELAHLAQYAVSINDKDLAAAIVSHLDGLTTSQRPFNAVELAQAMGLEEHKKGSEALKIADVRLKAILVAIRAWKADKANPFNTVAMALDKRTLDADVLKEVEDGAA